MALFLLVAEGAGRAWMHFRYGVPGKSYGRWRGDPELGSHPKENGYSHRWQTNDGGFRGDEDVRRPKPEGALRVIAYGGSTTLCWNLPTPRTWPAVLESLLRAHRGSPGDQVLNAGDILWSIGQIAVRARREAPRLRPDIVLIASGLNEESNARYLAAAGTSLEAEARAGRFGAYTRDLPQCSWLVRNSVVAALAQSQVARPARRLLHLVRPDPWSELLQTPIDAAHPPRAPDPWILENYRHVLGELIDSLRAEGARVAYIIEARGAETVGLRLLSDYSRAGAVTAVEHGALVVDAQEVVAAYAGDPMDLFRESGVHWSALGARLLARKIWSDAFAGGETAAPAADPAPGR
jgi:hypothetical protein